nr:HAD-IIIA family hydrolase [Candidatus Sigynarchaeota archaeon]
MVDIKLLLGFPASGKSTYAREYASKGYCILNRDTLGGNLDKCVSVAEESFQQGKRNFLFENTYGTVESRAPVIAWAKKHDIPIECLWMTTSIGDAQINAVMRQLQRYGHLLSLEELKAMGKKDPNMFPPVVHYVYRKNFQEPTLSEGFEKITTIPFVRQRDPNVYCNKSIIVDYDGTLRKIKGQDPKMKKSADGKKLRQFPIDPSEIEILPRRAATLERYIDQGYLMLGISNQSGIGHGIVNDAQAKACFDATNKMLGIEIDYLYCPHNMGAGGIPCYCRKPNPGNGVLFIEKYKLDPSQCIVVGDQKTDASFAGVCGFKYMNPDQFFK